MDASESTIDLPTRLQAAAFVVAEIESHGLTPYAVAANKASTIISLSTYKDDDQIVETLVAQYGDPTVVGSGITMSLSWSIAPTVLVRVVGFLDRYLSNPNPTPVPAFRLPEQVES